MPKKPKANIEKKSQRTAEDVRDPRGFKRKIKKKSKKPTLTIVSKIKSFVELVNPDGEVVAFDGGFRFGRFTENVLEQFANARTIGFEPDPHSWAIAQSKLGDLENVEIVKAALGAEIGASEFYRGPIPGTNSLKPRPSSGARPYYPETATLDAGPQVQVVTIDSECEKRGLPKIDILKLDLQGGELDALKGGSALLGRGGASVVMAEVVFIEKYHQQPMFWEIWQYLASFGYTLHSLEGIKIGLYHEEPMSMRHYQWNQADALFISPAVRQALDALEPA